MSERLLPHHIALVMDGNRRWAKKRFLPVNMGHAAGVKTFEKIAKYCNKIGLKYLSVYAFSTENWNRSKDEVSALMKLFWEYLNKAVRDLEKENIKIVFLGDLSRFSEDAQILMKEIVERSSKNTGLTLNVAVNYGSKEEILHAAKIMSEKYKNGEISAKDFTEENFSNFLYTKSQPDIDLFIRPSGEQRISNFLLWQCAYAEFIFQDVLWPDFSPKNLDNAIEEFLKRDRRFGE